MGLQGIKNASQSLFGLFHGIALHGAGAIDDDGKLERSWLM